MCFSTQLPISHPGPINVQQISKSGACTWKVQIFVGLTVKLVFQGILQKPIKLQFILKILAS